MAITDPVLLSPDVILVPVAELPEEVRRRLDPGAGDWAITHPRARTPSRLIDAPSAALLDEFKSPRTIVDAVIRYSQARDLDPESTLVEAYPLLERLLAAGFLVAEGSDEAGGIASSLAPGERVAGFEVLETVQALEDTEAPLGAVGGRHGGPEDRAPRRPWEGPGDLRAGGGGPGAAGRGGRPPAARGG